MGLVDFSRFPRRSVLCIDVKSFFASVEAVRRGLDPLEAYIVVVSDVRRAGAIVLASSPRVKLEYNIKTGNRLFEIPKHSPIMVVEPNMALYINVNQAIQNIFRRFVTDEDLHVYSIDESILDVTASRNLFGSAEVIAAAILKIVKDELGLIVTVGIGDNPLLAKLALDNEAKKRPPWIAKWTYEMVPETVWKIQPLTAFWGISRGYDQKLKRMGIYTIEGLAHANPLWLQKTLGVIGVQLYYHAWGLDASIISQKERSKRKSYSKNQILMRDYDVKEEILMIIKEMVGDVCTRLRKHQEKCQEVYLKIGYSDRNFKLGFTARIKLIRPEHATDIISEAARQEFSKRWQGEPVRSVNVTAGKIVSEGHEQLELFFEGEEKNHAIDRVVDDLRKRFGKKMIFYAGSMAGGTFLERADYVGGHKGKSE
ncbi:MULTISPECIES: Y-family DNA polymerase [Pelosinus]|uniref:UMUC domain protein DNA-repair protein n=1 Tax=Pelosinus fermentans B4 TaxID=1149862 RepID=I9LHA6_9FIRM|nr:MULTISPECIES: Y-family DNA polymerase [Pelosinus]EIW19771.1 UMUC domain protein DNA-repair protein [Pelosinus fermentans B4]EIW21372.1 UMUC domain protein DNA-repair protein [Pelosinus fermentans A11]OAM94925.1 DNA-directed DNA polymerase [Pelosinus fermentans DSM 17108]SDR20473.1 DNA polymerase V [Pelosinus fermentans]